MPARNGVGENGCRVSAAAPVIAAETAPSRRERVWATALATAGAVLVAAVAVRHPAAQGMRFEPSLLLAFDPSKLPPMLRSLAVLAAMNLAAWAAGGALRRILGGLDTRPVLDAVRRLALGFLVLADLVLMMTALRLLHGALLATLLLALATAGAVALARSARAWSPLASPTRVRPGPFVVALTAAAALILATVLLGAHVPDYGWDAFTYHLALPERYLFENRVVVSALFPHTAFPLTVEMLYTLVLALDPGPAAELLHAELGLLAAAAAWAMAARHAMPAGALAVLVLAADPLFNWELGVAYNDLGATLFCILALGSLQERLHGGGPAALRLAGIFAGACVATRYTAATVPLAMLGVLWLARRSVRDTLRDAAVIAALVALVLSPWLARNLVLTGNPVAPALQWLAHEPGREFFDPQAIEQYTAFVRRVGFGRGLEDLLALPLNLTLRAQVGDYRAFGFRIGPLSVVGLAAALALGAARRSSAVRGLLPAVALLTLGWFYTSQEPRYLLPALAAAAVAGGVGLHELLRSCAAVARPLGAAVALIVLAALVHAHWATALRLPYLYGYALGRLPLAAFKAQEPALVLAERLRPMLGRHHRLLLVYEPRGFFFRGLDYVFAHDFALMQVVHRVGDSEGLADELRERGVSHVLVNTNNIARYRTVEVPGYGQADLDRDLQTLFAMLRRHSTLVDAERGVFVRRMAWAAASR